jgi:hypothetical protein
MPGRKLQRRRLAAAGGTLLLIGGASLLKSADHIDAPVTTADAPADINDLFVFTSPENTSNVVFAMTVNPLITPPNAAAARFPTDVLYQWKIDTNGDAVEDLVLQARFVDDGDEQRLIVRGPSAPSTTGRMSMELDQDPLVSGRTSAVHETYVASDGPVRAFAGVRDDPFYIDLTRLLDILAGNQTAFRDPGVDALAGVNTLAIVVEFPKSMLGGASDIGVWATTSRALN